MSDIFDYPTLGGRPATYASQFTQALSKAADTFCMGVPFRIDPDGSVAVSEGRGHIMRQELLTLIMTFIGERLMMPFYGSNLPQFVWEGQSTAVVDSFLKEIESLVQEHFPEVTILDLSLSDPSDDGSLTINFEYIYDNTSTSLPIDATNLLSEGT